MGGGCSVHSNDDDDDDDDADHRVRHTIVFFQSRAK